MAVRLTRNEHDYCHGNIWLTSTKTKFLKWEKNRWRARVTGNRCKLEESREYSGLRPSQANIFLPAATRSARAPIMQRQWRWIGHATGNISHTTLLWTPEGKRKWGWPKITWCQAAEGEGPFRSWPRTDTFVAILHASQHNGHEWESEQCGCLIACGSTDFAHERSGLESKFPRPFSVLCRRLFRPIIAGYFS